MRARIEELNDVRILCCLNRDLVSSYALNLLLPALAAHDVHVALSDRIGSASALAEEPRSRIMLRTVEQTLATEAFFPLLERSGHPDDGRRHLTFGELERLRGIPVASLPSPNSPEGMAAIAAFAPDLILSVRYGAIFKAASIALPRYGVLNLHAGILPAYRGVIASFRALLHGDAEIGCTLHYITDGTIDTGPIVAIARVPVQRGRSLFAHVLSLYPEATPLIAQALEQLARDEQPSGVSQTGGTYYGYPTEAEWDEFARAGWEVATPMDLQEAFRRYMPPHSR